MYGRRRGRDRSSLSLPSEGSRRCNSRRLPLPRGFVHHGDPSWHPFPDLLPLSYPQTRGGNPPAHPPQHQAPGAGRSSGPSRWIPLGTGQVGGPFIAAFLQGPQRAAIVKPALAVTWVLASTGGLKSASSRNLSTASAMPRSEGDTFVGQNCVTPQRGRGCLWSWHHKQRGCPHFGYMSVWGVGLGGFP